MDHFTVGIMLKKDAPDGPAFESKDAKFETDANGQTHEARFLPDAEPPAVAQALPAVSNVELPIVGLTGSLSRSLDDLLAATPETEPQMGEMAQAQFFGAQVWGSKFVYVIDQSGSMAQRDRLGAAKRELLASLAKLPPDAQFQIVFYNLQATPVIPGTELKQVSAKLHYATDQNKLIAARELDKIIAEKGTAHLPALTLALSLKPDVIFLLTDADDMRANDVSTVTDLNKHQVKIHAIEFGVGAEVDRLNQLRELARVNGGTYRYIDAARPGRTTGTSDQ
jgi:hypothetical protein